MEIKLVDALGNDLGTARVPSSRANPPLVWIAEDGGNTYYVRAYANVYVATPIERATREPERKPFTPSTPTPKPAYPVPSNPGDADGFDGAGGLG